ncbi:MAG: cytochrome c oxidase assembly protein, partial [Verrucomicrobia bacterium]|nr:cytochrome c oxidase assembly protein [Verrucomicrobiota bacterium]
MSPVTQAVLSSWTVDPFLFVALLINAFLYLRGWRVLRHTAPARFTPSRLLSFIAGLLAVAIALLSPLDAFAGLLLSAHMIQHLLLFSVAPPLILLGSPYLPILRGLPRRFAHDVLGPFLTAPFLHRIFSTLTHPIFCWLAFTVSLCAWHIPAAFDLALRSPFWHKVEHASFVLTALLFWWLVVQPFPARPRFPRWIVPLYLLAADLINTILCATLAFSEHALYSVYSTVPRLFGSTPLSDQVAAAVIMWVPGSLIFLIPAVVILISYLSPSSSLAQPSRSLPIPHVPKPPLRPSSPFDLLALPILGPIFRSLVTRRLFQTLTFLLAIAVILHGFLGPAYSPNNLAGVLPWIYWRGLTIIALLIAGNFFCYACPFTLPRALARKLGFSLRNWPRP